MDYLFMIIAYLSGSIPYGLILAKFFGRVDVRKIGSGNIGATNVWRTGRKSIAILTLVCDALKGFLPVFLASCVGIQETSLLVIAFVAVMGHVFPIWLNYKGGKGIATSLGVFWALSIPLGVFTVSVWIIVIWMTRVSSLSALCAFALSPVFAAFILSWPVSFFSFSIGLLTFWTHRENIQRLMAGKESKIEK